MVSNVEVSWHTNRGYIASYTTALTVNELLVHPFCNVMLLFLRFYHGLNRELFTIFVNSVLEELLMVVSNVISSLVLKVQAYNIAGHSWQHDINVNMELVTIVRCLNAYRA